MNSQEVTAKIRELESLRNKTSWLLRASTFALLILVVCCLASLRDSAVSLFQEGPRQRQFTSELSTRIQQNVLPSVQQTVGDAFRGINYQAELQKLNTRTPELTNAAVAQLNLLSKDLPERGTKVINTNFDTILQSREAKIRQMFPNATEEQMSAMMASLTGEAHTQTADVAQTLFTPHVNAMHGIMGDLNTIKQKEGSSVQGAAPTWDTVLLIFDLAAPDFKGLQPVQDTPVSGNGKTKEAKR